MSLGNESYLRSFQVSLNEINDIYAAVAALGLRDYSDLLLSLGERGLPMPGLPRHEVEAMADTMVRLIGRESAR